jgi:hypothetical protein
MLACSLALSIALAGVAQGPRNGKIRLVEENIAKEGNFNAEDADAAFLDTLLKTFSGSNLVYNAPGITLANIASRCFDFEKRIEKYVGKLDFKRKWYIGSPDSYWKALPAGRARLVREPYVDDFFYERDSLFDAGKITSKLIYCYFNPIFLKAVYADKTERKFAVTVMSEIHERYRCDPFGGKGYRIDLYEKKDGAWCFVENLSWGFD